MTRSPPSLWLPWGPRLFSAGAYIIHRRAMEQLLDTYLPGGRSCTHACGPFLFQHACMHLFMQTAAKQPSPVHVAVMCRGRHVREDCRGESHDSGVELARAHGLSVRTHPLLQCEHPPVRHSPSATCMLLRYPDDRPAGEDVQSVPHGWGHMHVTGACVACKAGNACTHAQLRTYICTDITIVEQSGESMLDTSHRQQHDSTAALVQHVLRQRGFMVLDAGET